MAHMNIHTNIIDEWAILCLNLLHIQMLLDIPRCFGYWMAFKTLVYRTESNAPNNAQKKWIVSIDDDRTERKTSITNTKTRTNRDYTEQLMQNWNNHPSIRYSWIIVCTRNSLETNKKTRRWEAVALRLRIGDAKWAAVSEFGHEYSTRTNFTPYSKFPSVVLSR